MRVIITTMAACLLAYGQPQDFVGAGASYNSYAVPQVNGWAVYARQIVGQRIYTFNTAETTSVTYKPFTVQVSYRTGIATPILESFGPFTVFGLADAGVAAGGSNVGGSFSAGGVAVAGLHRGWKLLIPVKIMKTSLSDRQVSIGLGVGWGR